MYSDDAELNVDHVMACLYAAKKYALGGLIEMCTTFFENAIAIGNVCTLHEQAMFYGETSLKAKCFEYIVANPNDVFKTNGFRKLSYDSLLSILTCDHLSSDESMNFSAAKDWAYVQCKEKNLDAKPEHIRACLGEVLFSIRFPLMAIDTFAKMVTPTGILTSEEMLILYHYLATTSVKEEVRMIGKFSCNRRIIAIIIDNRRLTQSYEGLVLLLNTSMPLQLVSVEGNFVPNVEKINVSNILRNEGLFQIVSKMQRNDIKFTTVDDQLYFTEPLIASPHSENIEIVFQMKSVEGLDNLWSSKANITHSAIDTIIKVTRVPHGLKSIVFK